MRIYLFILLMFYKCCFLSIYAFDSFIVKKIYVNGLKNISEFEVKFNMTFSEGSLIQEDILSKNISLLYQLGVFQNIKILRDNNDIIVDLIENPRILIINMNQCKWKKKIFGILSSYNIETGIVYNKINLFNAIKEIKYLFHHNGFFNVKIFFFLKKEKNFISIFFEIFPGEVGIIKNFFFNGNKSLKSKDILHILNYKSKNIFSRFNQFYYKENIDIDMEILRSYYIDCGFININIDNYQALFINNKNYIDMYININEGEKFFFDTPSLEIDNSEYKDVIFKIINKEIFYGKIFSRQKLLNIQAIILSYLTEHGYFNSHIIFNVFFDETKKVIKVIFLVYLNNKVTVRNIDINGNFLTKDWVIRRNIDQKEYSYLNTSKIELSKYFLNKLGIVKKVEINYQNVSNIYNIVDVSYNVEEEKNNKFSTNLGYNNSDGLIFSVGADLINVLGSGNDINFVFEKSKVKKDYKFEYYNPYFYSNKFGIGYSIYFRLRDLMKDFTISNYTNNTFGGNIFCSLRKFIHSKWTFVMGIDKINIDFSQNKVPYQILNFVEFVGKIYLEHYLSFNWDYNTLDSKLIPSQGLKQNVNINFGMPWSKINYYKFNYKINKFIKIFNSYVLSCSQTLGYANIYYKNMKLPFYQNYFTGGVDTIRGFQDNSVGPMDSKKIYFGGNFLLNTKIICYFPLSWLKEKKNIRTSLFLDIGQVYNLNSLKNLYNVFFKNLKLLKCSVGLSINWNTPLGIPVEISFSKPFNLDKYDVQEHLSFNMNMGI